MISSWENCERPFAANAYEYLRIKGILAFWEKVV
jgi:hypothetical protein